MALNQKSTKYVDSYVKWIKYLEWVKTGFLLSGAIILVSIIGIILGLAGRPFFGGLGIVGIIGIIIALGLAVISSIAGLIIFPRIKWLDSKIIENPNSIDPLITQLLSENLKHDERKKISILLDKFQWTPTNDDEHAYYLIAKENWNELKKLINSGYKNAGPFLATLTSLHFVIDSRRDQIFINEIDAFNTFISFGEPLIDPLLSALHTSNRQILCHNAMLILGELGEERAVEPLIKALGSDFIPDKEYALYALERIENKKDHPLLLPSLLTLLERFAHPPLDDEQVININKQVSNILIQIGRPSVIPLLQLLNSGKGSQRSILSILQAIKDESVIKPIIDDILSSKFKGDELKIAGNVLIEFGEASVQPLEGVMRQENNSMEWFYLKSVLDQIKKNSTTNTQ